MAPNAPLKTLRATLFQKITGNERYVKAKQELLACLQEGLQEIHAPRPAVTSLKKSYDQLVADVGEFRGRELFYKYVTSGAGSGPFVELADGSVKYDLITGIGVNFFGHGNLDLFEAQMDSLWCDVNQGNLGPGPEYAELMRVLLESVQKSRLKHVWLTTCGATANEIALKVIRQKKYPASRIFAFENCFAGRTTALQEITDNPKYREGQPVYGEVSYLPFYNPQASLTAKEQGELVAKQMKATLDKYPGKYACLEFEIVQGEGGFNAAPREFLVPILEQARQAGLAIWIDEIQTFGRTGEVFCYQRLGLDEYVDVVTAAKMLQVGAVLYTADLNPKPGLVSGTFSGGSGALRAGIRTLERLKEEFCGPKGRIKNLENLTHEQFRVLKSGAQGKHLVDYTVFGGMIAFTLFNGTLEQTKKFLNKLWDLGAIAFFCGHGPYRVRMLPPFGVITDEQWVDVFRLIDKAIAETAVELK